MFFIFREGRGEVKFLKNNGLSIILQELIKASFKPRTLVLGGKSLKFYFHGKWDKNKEGIKLKGKHKKRNTNEVGIAHVDNSFIWVYVLIINSKFPF